MRGGSSVFIRKTAHVPLLKLRSLALAIFCFVLLDGLFGGFIVAVLGLFFSFAWCLFLCLLRVFSCVCLVGFGVCGVFCFVFF